LVVRIGREGLCLLGGFGGVALDEEGHDPAGGLDAERKGHDFRPQHQLLLSLRLVSIQDGRLHRCVCKKH